MMIKPARFMANDSAICDMRLLLIVADPLASVAGDFSPVQAFHSILWHKSDIDAVGNLI